jgi:hypothetical protein
LLTATPNALHLLYAEAYELAYLPDLMLEIAGLTNRQYASLGRYLADDMRRFVTDQLLHD